VKEFIRVSIIRQSVSKYSAQTSRKLGLLYQERGGGEGCWQSDTCAKWK